MTPWVAWMFDQAILAAGTFVQNRLDERDDKHKAKWTFEQVIMGHAMPAATKQSTKERWKAIFGQAMR